MTEAVSQTTVPFEARYDDEWIKAEGKNGLIYVSMFDGQGYVCRPLSATDAKRLAVWLLEHPNG